jgi:hypothetical protein
MSKKLLLLIFVLIPFAIACSGESGVLNNSTNNNNNPGDCADEDNDTICDDQEGRDTNRDSDGDSIPDYLDNDSDNDGIPDSVEAGDATSVTPPKDSDFDGTPDYLDQDSDNNTIPDSVEGTGDMDFDGIPDFSDSDNDGDFIPDITEIGDSTGDPVNTDGGMPVSDATPDYMDPDSDNDGIGDFYEGATDADGDGIPNYQDTDSDNDGISDAIEGGTNGDIRVQPVDTDEDEHYDFMDADSDNDGLSDSYEDTNHNGILDPGETDRLLWDTDGDGVSDLIEDAAGTDPQDPLDNPQAAGNFVFTVPFEEDPDPPEDTLNFSTNFQMLDMFIVEDLSTSMNGERTDMLNGFAYMLDSVVCTGSETPTVDQCVPDVESGAMGYLEIGDEIITKIINGNNLLNDGVGLPAESTEALIPTTAIGGSMEAPIHAMEYLIGGSCSDNSRIGRACFRPNAMKLIVLLSDEDLDQDSYWNGSLTAAGQGVFDDILDFGIRLVVVYGIDVVGTDLAVQTSGISHSVTGENSVPEIHPTASAGIPECAGISFLNNRTVVEINTTIDAGDALTCAVKAVASYIPQQISAVILNDPTNQTLDGTFVDAPAEFIDVLEVFMAGDATCPSGYLTLDLIGPDGHDDAFDAVLPGNPVCWKIIPKENITVEGSTVAPQSFKATIEVYGDGGAFLDSREVWFLVPQVIEGPGVIGKK